MQRSNRSNREPSQEEAAACAGSKTGCPGLQASSAAGPATAGHLGVLLLQYSDAATVVDVFGMRQDEDELLMPCTGSRMWIYTV